MLPLIAFNLLKIIAITSNVILREVDCWIQGGREMKLNFLNSYNVPEARIFNYQHLLNLTCAKLCAKCFHACDLSFNHHTYSLMLVKTDSYFPAGKTASQKG